MRAAVRYHEFKTERASVIQRKLVNGNIGNLQTVYKGAVFC